MPTAELSRRVGKVVGYPPLSAMSERQRRDSTRRYSTPTASRSCQGKWQAAILKAERNRPRLAS
jgi:hypothetical protein